MTVFPFIKTVASGNDFIVLDFFAAGKVPPHPVLVRLAKDLCRRRFSVGADGILVIARPAKKHIDFAMRIFNPDGTEAEMCGNGARASALYAYRKGIAGKTMVFSTLAGKVSAVIKSSNKVMIKVMTPRYQRACDVSIEDMDMRVYAITTGVPHAVVFVEDLATMDFIRYAAPLRYHGTFAPKGTNVDFVRVGTAREKIDIAIRTYERGVEDETFSCGSGVVSSACVYVCEKRKPKKTGRYTVLVLTKSNEVLKVTVDYDVKKGIRGAYLEGNAEIVYAACKEMEFSR